MCAALATACQHTGNVAAANSAGAQSGQLAFEVWRTVQINASTRHTGPTRLGAITDPATVLQLRSNIKLSQFCLSGSSQTDSCSRPTGYQPSIHPTLQGEAVHMTSSKASPSNRGRRNKFHSSQQHGAQMWAHHMPVRASGVQYQPPLSTTQLRQSREKATLTRLTVQFTRQFCV
jgi:hypothetical protein